MLRSSRKTKRRIFAALSINITCSFSTHKYADVNKTSGSILHAYSHPNENSLLKLLYMGIQNASKKWTMPLQNWNLTLSQLSIYFEGRLDDVLDI